MAGGFLQKGCNCPHFCSMTAHMLHRAGNKEEDASRNVPEQNLWGKWGEKMFKRYSNLKPPPCRIKQVAKRKPPQPATGFHSFIEPGFKPPAARRINTKKPPGVLAALPASSEEGSARHSFHGASLRGSVLCRKCWGRAPQGRLPPPPRFDSN